MSAFEDSGTDSLNYRWDRDEIGSEAGTSEGDLALSAEETPGHLNRPIPTRHNHSNLASSR